METFFLRISEKTNGKLVGLGPDALDSDWIGLFRAQFRNPIKHYLDGPRKIGSMVSKWVYRQVKQPIDPNH